MPHVASSAGDLLERLDGVIRIGGDRLTVEDEGRLRDAGIRDLAWTAAFTSDDSAAEAARWIVWEVSQALAARSASIHELYMARARGEVHGFTVPAINLRAQTFDMSRIVFEAATDADVDELADAIVRVATRIAETPTG